MSKKTNTPEAIEMILMTKKWFDNRINQLRLITEATDPIMVQGKDDTDRIEVKGEALKGLKLGAFMAIDLFGDFPITISNDEEE